MTQQLTPRIVAYIASEEGLVPQAYLDSKNVWTWALGVTNASGHAVHPCYLGKPQPLEECIRVSVWLMAKVYLPPVLRAFAGFALNEVQLAAALSFHWNTGAIGKAQWVKDVVAGKLAAGEADIMQWCSRGLLTKRREREQHLFFHGAWPASLKVPVYKVSASHHPADAQLVDLLPVITKVMAEQTKGVAA